MNARRAVAAAASIMVFAGTGIAYAEPHDVTVDSSGYPVCVMEDCSDQPGQRGVWFDPDTGEAWLSLGDYSIHVDQVLEPVSR